MTGPSFTSSTYGVAGEWRKNELEIEQLRDTRLQRNAPAMETGAVTNKSKIKDKQEN